MNNKTAMSNTVQEKKPFDSTICFTFFGTWAAAIFALETEEDRSSDAYMLFKAIAEYNLYGVMPDFEGVSPAMKALWPLVEREADLSIERRKRGFAKEEPSKQHEAIIDAVVNNPEASVREIADMLGTSKSTVQRVKDKYDDTIKKRRKAAEDDERDGERYVPPGVADPELEAAYEDEDLPF